jgi:hypothetical protein
MKTSTFVNKIPLLGRISVCLVVLGGALVVAAGACNEAGQGDRCNPLRSSNECGGGLVCAGNPIGQSTTYPIPFCPENYCCPVTADGLVDYANATSPYCQPGCNGGAASICAAGGAQPDAEACEVMTCLEDASDPVSCVPPAGGPEPSADAEVPGDGGADGGPTEASTSETGPSSEAEAAAEAAAPSEAGPVTDAAAGD